MKNILSELFYGNINPTENLEIEDMRFNEYSKKSINLEAKLIEELNEEQKVLFDEMMNFRMSSSALEVTQGFIDGFKLGALIILEVTKCQKEK